MKGADNKGDRAGGRLERGWLLLSVFSLVFAGIFALMVAMARTPGVQSLLPLGRDYIYVALVGHVVLAVVIWFLAFEGFLWVHATTALIGRRVWSAPLGYLSLLCSAGGVSLVAVSALFALGPAVLANYVPVLTTPVFYAGLALFAAGICGNLFNTALAVIKAVRAGVSIPPAAFGMCASGAAVAVAFLCVALSGYLQYSTGKTGLDFERLFWGGGHMLQFANTIAMASSWLYLSALLFKGGRHGGQWAKLLLLAYFLFILPSPLIYFMYDASHPAYMESFTWLMQWGLGPITAVFIVATLRGMLAQRERQWKDPGFSSLFLSIVVFAIGGAIAVNISGANTIIPAHYHCSIGAVTIAFMGLFYKAAPLLGRRVRFPRLASVQPWLYSLGVVMFALGLFLAGSHGVERKTYGAEQHLDSIGRFVGMAIMGAGSLVAIAGGIAFVWNALATLLGGAREVRRAGHDGVTELAVEHKSP